MICFNEAIQLAERAVALFGQLGDQELVLRNDFDLMYIKLQMGQDILSRLLAYDLIKGVRDKDIGALFDQLQPVFGERFMGLRLLTYRTSLGERRVYVGF